jgi:hypothetical protein
VTAAAQIAIALTLPASFKAKGRAMSTAFLI